MVYKILPIIGLFLLPQIVWANIIITEVMYDLEGTDSKREWIEIYNNGGNAIDISDWRFNDGSNHTFNAPPEKGSVGSLLIPKNEYAILASDAEVFLQEHTYSRTVIDTVMSLNNSNETLLLLDEDGVVVETVSYASDQGANGNGLSLQLDGEVWKESTPTVGSGFIETDTTQETVEENSVEDEVGTTTDETATTSTKTIKNDDTEEQTETKSSPPVYSGPSAPINPNITAYAGEMRSGVSGGLVSFSGIGYGLLGELLSDDNTRYLWNLGDGTIKEGKNIVHTFVYPGTYTVVLNISFGEYSVSDTVIATITDPNIEITHIDEEKITLKNNSSKSIDISFWRVRHNDLFFSFPKNTFIAENAEISFARTVTGFVFSDAGKTTLHFPNGTIFSTHTSEEEEKMGYIEAPLFKEIEIIQDIPTKEIKVIEIVEENPVVVSTSTIATATPFVAAASIKTQKSSGSYKWLLALISIITLASLIIITGRNEDGEMTADDIRIID